MSVILIAIAICMRVTRVKDCEDTDAVKMICCLFRNFFCSAATEDSTDTRSGRLLLLAWGHGNYRQEY